MIIPTRGEVLTLVDRGKREDVLNDMLADAGCDELVSELRL